ncbi:MAG: polymerase sigma-B factor [Nocardioidaceae bacterium]|jgi:RNA polymerase sigma-B factor|nr:polymerase sigma-B factor [Nocardioidaceae bacterium]
MTHSLEVAFPLRMADLPSREERSERTTELLRRRATADDEERREIVAEIVRLNRGVAVALANRYRGRGVALDDLCQTAFEGLTKAVLRFDPELSEDLLTFAVPTIRGELQRHFRDRSWTVRPPRRVQELQQEVNKASEELCQTLGHEPSVREIADRLGVDEEDVIESLRLHECFRPVSLDQTVLPGSETSLGELIPADEQGRNVTEARMALAPVVRDLTERDRRILYLRFFEDRTQEEIGQDLGVSQMQVSRLLTRLLGHLREQLA